MTQSPYPTVKCVICGKPVSILEARSGFGGSPVHGECLISQIRQIKEAALPKPTWSEIYSSFNSTPSFSVTANGTGHYHSSPTIANEMKK